LVAKTASVGGAGDGGDVGGIGGVGGVGWYISRRISTIGLVAIYHQVIPLNSVGAIWIGGVFDGSLPTAPKSVSDLVRQND
jgi:hypothetical protein